MDHPNPRETDWLTAPGLLDGALELELTAERCNLEYWIKSVTQGTWSRLHYGRLAETSIPQFMHDAGPLRTAIEHEYAFRAIAEEMATRALGYLVAYAPDMATMQFYATQLIDEARHCDAFRHHLIELGIPEQGIDREMQRIAGKDSEAVLRPLENFGLHVMRDDADFIGGVIIITVLVEGVLAPSAELSERKWRPLDPAAADIGRGANIDEIRHLAVGSSIVRQHLLNHPDDKRRILDLIVRGREMWKMLPTDDLVYKREVLFQQGIEQHTDKLEEYELIPGRRLLDTDAEERLGIANDWSTRMQESRLRYMGLSEAIPR